MPAKHNQLLISGLALQR